MVAVCGVEVDDVDMSGAVETIVGWAGGDTSAVHVAIGVNAAVCTMSRRDRRFAELLGRASMRYADGQSVVWASRLLGAPLPERLATTDLVHPLARRCAQEGLPVFLLGGEPGVAEAAAERLRSADPELRVAAHHGFVGAEDDERLRELVTAHGTRVLLVGMGEPRQQEWVDRNRATIGVPAVLTCGGLFDWTSGRHERAPRWMIDAGLEWLWRIRLEPRRLGPRYLVSNPEFVARVGAQALVRAWRDRPGASPVAT